MHAPIPAPRARATLEAAVSRRRFGHAVLGSAALGLLGGPGTVRRAWAAVPAPASAAAVRALHACDRLGFGPAPGDLARIESMGVERWIEQQLQPASLGTPPFLQQLLNTLPVLRLRPAEAWRRYGSPAVEKLSGTDQQMARAAANRDVIQQAFAQRVWRALYSPAQLQEVLVAFWCNHFNVFRDKGDIRLWIPDYENTAIRPHVLGRFRDLLGAVAHHPAMLLYLDNYVSSRDLPPKAPGQPRRLGLNENYGRELLELHTLGVNGGYTQQDVIAVARALTGWSIGYAAMKAGGNDAFAFVPARHDTDPITVLGQPLPQTGQAQGEAVLDLLARHPATARHICFQLAQVFVADQPPADVTAAMTATFSRTDGDLRAVMQTLVQHPRFWAPATLRAKFKTPYEFIVSAVRAGGVQVRNVLPLVNAMQQMGQPLYGWLTPEGYRTTADAWTTPDALLMRIDFADRLARGQYPLAQFPPAVTPFALTPTTPGTPPAAMAPAALARSRAWAPLTQSAPAVTAAGIPVKPPPSNSPPLQPAALIQTLGPQLSPATLQTVAQAPAAQQATAILGSEDFMRR